MAIFSALAPPPMSRKFAACAPAWATTSSVDITSPAPLPMIPTSPSSFTYCRSASLARFSTGSIGNASASASISGWRNSALSSIVTFASRAHDGAVLQLHQRVDLDERRVHLDEQLPQTAAARRPRPRGAQRQRAGQLAHVPGAHPEAGFTCTRRIASGRSAASVSMSIPPSAVSIQRYSPIDRSSSTEV